LIFNIKEEYEWIINALFSVIKKFICILNKINWKLYKPISLKIIINASQGLKSEVENKMYFKIFNLLILSSLQLFLFNYIKIKIYFHKKGNRLNFTKKI